MAKRSVALSGHRTSLSVEDAFWDELKSIAGERGLTLNRLIEKIDAGRGGANLSSAVRVFVLESLRRRLAG